MGFFILEQLQKKANLKSWLSYIHKILLVIYSD